MRSNLLDATPSKFGWSVEQVSRNVHNLRVTTDNTSDWVFPVLLTSDWHWDNPKCQREKLKQHLEEAKRANIPVVCYGDLFCCMQGKWDRRADKADIRPEHTNGDYLDALVRTAAEWLEPYKDILAVISPGNHESSIRNRHETDLIERLVERLRTAGSNVYSGGYSGWVRCIFQRPNTSSSRSVRIHYHHGWGGGGPVTKGVIGTNRKATYIADADVCAGGHVHESWDLDLTRIRLNEAGNVEHTHQLHVCTPGYKEEYEDGHGGWHIETGKPPKPTGAYWLYIAGNKDFKTTTRALATG